MRAWDLQHCKDQRGKKKQGTVIVVGIAPGHEGMGFTALQGPTRKEKARDRDSSRIAPGP